MQMTINKTLVIHGASRLAAIAYSFIQDQYDQVYRYIDPSFLPVHEPTSIDGNQIIIPIISSLSSDCPVDYVSSIGYKNMTARKIAFENIVASKPVSPINIVHPNAFVSPDAILGLGNIIFPGVIIENGACIGDNNIIWSNSCICHDATLGSHNFIAASSIIGGFSHMGNCVFLGFGSIINDKISIASNSFLASGAVVTKNIDTEKTRVCGVPAKIMTSGRQPRDC
ncbi:hypothetical protein KBY57_04155 [Cyanobium sp. Aljojuca 7D2]|uniref:hypothetical protein n=1 Tax=Cyanobium sp. Aljojuca 7D2 TaxID=2823698 RepID=UPI0020CBBEA9|nr:hypothetical protein [Cyanobium sp. Aljojuca 7D2]MCP9890257.1 hypothetical protein [Cyanobium sp. Aljojuca 7D2]